ncbi:MAG: hypothetical protein AB7V18_04680 [Pyrinomonadaceae bacterium]|jgi:hypothetical protein
MKKIRIFGLMLVLSLSLAGNIFAIGPVTTVVPGLLSLVVERALSMFGGGDSCPLRTCQNCRPNNEADGDGNGDCRPTPN